MKIVPKYQGGGIGILANALRKTYKPASYIKNSNARSISDAAWDKAYFRALNVGDMKEVQRLRDLHFTAKAPDAIALKPWYHGNSSDQHITVFDPQKIGSRYGNKELGGFWFVDDPEIAKWEYSVKPDFAGNSLENLRFGEVLPVYINMKNPSFLKQGGLKVEDTPFGNLAKTSEDFSNLIKRAKEINNPEGYVFKLVDVNGDSPFFKSAQNQAVVKNPNAIKLSSPVTYDDNNKIIPLSKRDDFSKKDIRWGITPWLLGTSLAAPELSDSNQ